MYLLNDLSEERVLSRKEEIAKEGRGKESETIRTNDNSKETGKPTD